MKRLRLAAPLLVVLGLLAPLAPTRAEPAEVFLRVNQVGYPSAGAKAAFALSTESLEGATFRVETAAGATVLTHEVGADRGAYGDFAHLYELDLTAVETDGSYRVVLGDAASPTFRVGRASYRELLSTTLRFFEVQRCGDTDPALHGPCHLTDGTADGGPRDGEHVDATGGWHDAGDYIKFLITQGASVALILQAYDRNPEAFRSGDALPPVLAEATVGLEWIAKLWDGRRGVLYYQVGDGSDHDVWRLPEGDDATNPGRRVLACRDGLGANVAGKAAAALALAAVIWGDESAPFHDAARAERYATAAREIYAYGKDRPAAQSSTNGFYVEESWQDDMALAAVELYRATGDAKYLKEAKKLAKRAGAPYAFDWGELHALALYELGRADEASRAKSARQLAKGLDVASSAAGGDTFGLALSSYHWGSTTSVTGVALEALWYEDLTGDSRYRALAEAQRDYVLGRNPWGVCFVSGAGSVWPHFPHHQIANIHQSELTGFWDEGPVRASVFEGQGLQLSHDDVYAEFQTETAVYHDDVEDYVTNEPTLDAAAFGLAMTSWFAAGAD